MLLVVATMLLVGSAIAEPTPQGAQKPAPKPAPQTTTPAAAQWAQPFAPAVGSRWLIVSEHTYSDASLASQSGGRLILRRDLAFTAREGTGYRVTLVLREAAVEGVNSALQLTANALAAFRDLKVEAITDAAGVPLQVVNEAAVRAAAASASNRLMAPVADKPQIVSLMRLMLSNFLDPKGAAAAAAWLDPLPRLAAAQNTALERGAESRIEDTLPSPLGGTIRSTTVKRLAPNARPERFTLLATTTPDPASTREVMLAVARQIAAGQPQSGLNERTVKQVLSQMKADIHMNQEIEVEGGMARHALFEQVIDFGLVGKRMTRTQTARITVTPAP
ncbi:hypothetical protein V5F63_00745 [Xanthobacter autotrophicus DSM 597]|uniref:hypothetical protein n=1 Tax=Xanthobacter wiegelii TaxID=3119913 RepID=UPI00372A396E